MPVYIDFFGIMNIFPHCNYINLKCLIFCSVGMGKIVVYVGTYSEVLGHVPNGKGRGIELFEYDTEYGSLSPLSVQVPYLPNHNESLKIL